MKRRFKRIASLVLAMVMVFAMAMPGMTAAAASATDDPKTITINDAPNGHVFNAYQIFKGNVNVAGDILSNAAWGDDINSTGREKLAQALGCDNDIKSVLEALSSITSEQRVQEILMAVWDADGFDNPPTGTVSTPAYDPANSGAKTTVTIPDLAQGYYLIIDEPQAGLDDVDNVVYSRMIVQLVDDETVTPKTDLPSADKQVQDKNDSTGETSGWQDSADYDIGDDVPFRFTGKVASDFSYYETYHYAFHDTLSAGLSFNNDVAVTIDGQPIPKDQYHVDTTDIPDGESFVVVFDNMKTIKNDKGEAVTLTASSEIVVTYSAKLTGDGVVIGNPGNPNKMYLEYSNNPQGDGTGKTPVETVVVFTYDVDINKQNEDNEGLEGAGFTLWKWNGTGWDAEKVFEMEASGTSFYLEGLDDGYYKVEETTVPDGYNKMEDKYFEIKATHTADGTTLEAHYGTWTDEPGAGGEHFTADNSGTWKVESRMEGEVEHTQAAVDTTIKNQKGTTLPETGGIGTTIFYVVGSVLVLAAVILLVTKRRMKG